MPIVLTRLLKRFLKDERGLSAVEYGLLAAGIAIGLYTIIAGIGTSLHAIYTSVGADLSLAN
ncbi:MAG TPA: Flp family type IVb pilin [Rhizomicrobium sp.]|nr:Flp family type IVb pilin [Rhizomicrobium sp.]